MRASLQLTASDYVTPLLTGCLCIVQHGQHGHRPSRRATPCRTQPMMMPTPSKVKISNARESGNCQNRKVIGTTSVFWSMKRTTRNSKPNPIAMRILMASLLRLPAPQQALAADPIGVAGRFRLRSQESGVNWAKGVHSIRFFTQIQRDFRKIKIEKIEHLRRQSCTSAVYPQEFVPMLGFAVRVRDRGSRELRSKNA